MRASRLTDGARFAENAGREALRDNIVGVFVTIANARLNDIQDLWGHASLQARACWVEVVAPVGPLPPGTPDTYAPRMDAVPMLG